MVKSPLVSVIVPTKNSKATIEKCLRSIRDQIYPKIEVIIVDGFSRDETRKVAERYRAKVFETGARRSEARNIGAEKCTGSLVFFVDSDMELDSSVVDECVKKIREGYDGVIIPEVSVGEGFWAECKALEKACYIGDDVIEAARFFKTRVFANVGGYDPELDAGEDWDLSQRVKKAGFKVGRVRASIRHDERRLRLWETVKRKYRYGKTIEKYSNKHPREFTEQLRIIRPAFLRNWRKLVREPVPLIGMFFMKFCEYGAGVLGMLVCKIRGQRNRK